jgi:hypothetical protein
MLLKHCSNCSAELADGARFCGACGHSVAQTDSRLQPGSNSNAQGFCTSCGLRRGPGRFCGGCGAQSSTEPTLESESLFEPGPPPSAGSSANPSASAGADIEAFFRKFKPQHWAAVFIISLIDILYLHWWWWAGLLAALGSVNSWIDASNRRKAKDAPSKPATESPPIVDAPPTDLIDETLADPVTANNASDDEPHSESEVTDVAAPARPVDKNQRSNVITSIVVVAAIVLGGFYILAAPYLSAFFLYSALERHDQPALERVVAFDDLRENLKRRLPTVPPIVINEMVTPSAVMTALETNSPSDLNTNDAPLLGYLIGSMHKDDYGHYLIADNVVLCDYNFFWRVCDVLIK